MSNNNRSKRILILIVLLCLVVVIVYAFQSSSETIDSNTPSKQEEPEQKSGNNISTENINHLEYPGILPNEKIISHSGYSFVYSEEHEQAKWIAYELTKEETNSLFERTDKFLVDPLVSTGTAENSDYANSGYDKGHLAPAADMGWSAVSMKESFYFSNMSPQLPGFNRGVWKRLEELMRSWASDYSAIYIVTGPVLQSGLPTIGGNHVSVPLEYYKVILDYTQPEIHAIGFLMPNASSSASINTFAVSIDEVESKTGIDFFPALPDDQETKLEKEVCQTCWHWQASKTNNGSGANQKSGTSVQCSGITKAGNRCTRMTSSENGRCYQHGGN
jgi:endonuclease G